MYFLPQCCALAAEFVQLDAQINRVAAHLVDLVGEPRDDSFTLRDLALLSLKTSLCRHGLMVFVVTIPSQAVEFTACYLILLA